VTKKPDEQDVQNLLAMLEKLIAANDHADAGIPAWSELWDEAKALVTKQRGEL